MNRLTASALVLLLWAVIYLPGLGSTEIKGEEGRRILPAITMLETGQWLLPYVGGKPFLRKPPLVNWAIAGSFWLTGVRNEWTARLPAAVCVLALGLTIVGTSGRGWISPETALVAAILAMTQFGLMAKARFAGAEIEGIYAPISGLAIVWWLAAWAQKRSPWWIWLGPGLLLGLASLAKGPSLHLVYFAAIVLTVLMRARQGGALRHPAPWTALALSAAIFAAWAVPYFQLPEAQDAAAVWKRQGVDRFTDSEFNAGNYFTNLPRGLADQLPWLLFAPLLVRKWRRPAGPPSGESEIEEILRSVTWSVAACFVVVLLIPGTLPRYVLPLGAAWALVLGGALGRSAPPARALGFWHLANGGLAALIGVVALASPLAAGFAPPAHSFDFAAALKTGVLAAVLLAICAAVISRRAVQLTATRLALTTALLFGLGSAVYASAAVPWIRGADDVRPFAAAINAAVPAGESLVIYDPGYLAAIFYLRMPYRYALTPEAIADAGWLLVRPRAWEKLARQRPGWSVVRDMQSRNPGSFLLLQRPPELQKLSPL